LAGAFVALAVAGLGVLGLASPAQAGHNEVAVYVDKSDAPCGPVVFATRWTIAEHQVANTVLVVRVDGQVQTAPVGGELAVGPFDAPTVVEWRVWGGGERDYDDPPLTDLDALLAHLAAGGDVLDADAPGVAWHALRVKGCVTPEEPTVTQFECATDADAGELVIPTQDGVVYDATSGPVPPGTYPVAASPAPGYAFPGDATTQWELVVNPVNGCPGEPGDPGEPGAPGGGGSVDGSESLPVTGSPVQTAAAVGGGLVALGTAAVVLPMWWQRRRRNALLGGLAE
jgi:hypothetical protein